MAAGHPTKAQWRTVRRYAIAGDAERVRSLLEELAAAYPQDDEVAAELQRLSSGQPLHITETAARRKQRLSSEALHALNAITAESPVHHTPRLPTAELTALRRRIARALGDLHAGGADTPPGIDLLNAAITAELTRRRRRTYRKRLRIAAAALAALALCGIAGLCLHRRAKHIEARLQTAYAAANWSAVDNYLSAASTGIYRLMNPQLEPLIDKVMRWQNTTEQKANELKRNLILYENLEATDTLTMEQRADMQRRIRALPAPFAEPLLARWHELCRPMQEEMERQKAAYLAELQDALQPPQYSGDARRDAELLRLSIRRLRNITANFGDAQEAYDLPHTLLTQVQYELSHEEQALSDIDQSLMLEVKLKTACTCAQYLRALAEFCPLAYPPARQLAKACHAMPDEEKLTRELRAARYGLPPDIHPDVITALVEKGPTFTQAYPATPDQVHLMQDTFTCRSLHRKFYEVIHPTGTAYFTEDYPEVTESAVSFDISELDPAFTIEPTRHQVWPNPQTVLVRSVDATALLRATEITREHFFIKSNIADLLGRITTVQAKTCPALAKAYLYRTLLELLRQNRAQEITGMAFSPTLRADAASFRKMEAQCGIPLTVECWFGRSRKVKEAEELCERWFHEHRDRNYTAEISRAFSRILRERPRYLGYVDTQGTPHYCERPAPAARVRYYSGGVLTLSPADKLHAPDALTPILAE